LCELGTAFRQVMKQGTHGQEWATKSQPDCQRLAMSPWGRDATPRVSKQEAPMIERHLLEQARLACWLRTHHRYVARDYRGVNLDSPGIVAARAFYAPQDSRKLEPEAYVRMHLTAALEPLTEKHPYAHAWLEVTRQVAPGA